MVGGAGFVETFRGAEQCIRARRAGQQVAGGCQAVVAVPQLVLGITSIWANKHGLVFQADDFTWLQ